MGSKVKVNDAEWFEIQFNPAVAREKYGIVLPTIPADDVQVGFTGLTGRNNLEQAFNFYLYARSISQINKKTQARILDFGGGWGRVARFFLRDTQPEYIYIADTMEYAIDCLHATGNPCQIIHNQPRPPINRLPGQFDLVYAYSVFSHLSEEYFHAWVNYLLEVLRPGGYLVFTTRGEYFIDHLEHLHTSQDDSHKMLEEHIRRLREDMPLPEEIRRRYQNGEFQFYPIGGSDELTSEFFGEAFIPKSYTLQHFGPYFVDFYEDIPNVDQSVVALRKPAGIQRLTQGLIALVKIGYTG
jgi:SAM-dependent methyltransferase